MPWSRGHAIALALLIVATGAAFWPSCHNARHPQLPTGTATAPPSAAAPAATGTPPKASVAVWQAYLDLFSTATAKIDTGYLFDHLDPAVFQIYTPDQCRAQLATLSPDPTFHFQVLSVTGPAPWPYQAAGQTINVLQAYAVDANVTSRGHTAEETHHFTLHSGALGWFTSCPGAATPIP